MIRALIFLFAVLISVDSAAAAPIEPKDILVIEGDLIRIHRKQPDVRLMGFNAPEFLRAQCIKEKAYGAKAMRRLREIVRGGNLDFAFAACPCAPGKEGTKACNNGRRCGSLKANGRDVGSILIEEKLAVSFNCSETSCPATPRPWCKGMGLR